MNCAKCNCGCDKLSKEELEVIIRSIDNARDFLKNPAARKMFRKMFYPDAPDTYAPQPSGSQNRGKPKAIKYLEYIEEAEQLLGANELSNDVVEEFVNRVPVDQYEELSERLEENTAETRAEVLDAIIKEFRERLVEDKLFKTFIEKLVEAYRGIGEIKKH